MRIDVTLSPRLAADLIAAERRYGLTRDEAVLVAVAAGLAELSPGYVERLRTQFGGRQE